MKFGKYIDEYCHMDDFGDSITTKVNGNCEYTNSDNVNIISESGLSRLIRMTDGKSFATITAYRNNMDKKEKIQKNRELRSMLNSMKMGVHQLVGHWRECQDDVPYEKCPKGKLVDVIERSYFVPKPDGVDYNDFEKTILSLVKKFKQDAAIISNGSEIYVLERSGKKIKIGTKLDVGKLGQAYSQHIKKMNTPFVFEGVELPSSIGGRRVMNEYGIKWIEE